MKYTSRYVMKRAKSLSKEQCEFIIRNLKYIPYNLELYTSHVPYIIGKYDEDEEDYDEFAPYEYEDNEDVIDYVSRMVSEMCLDTQRSEVTDLPWQWYRASYAKLEMYKIPWEVRTYYDPNDDSYKKWTYNEARTYDYHKYNNKSTAIGMETYTETLYDVIRSGILPLALADENCLSLYACSPLKDGVPCGGFVGKGMSTIEELWRELGGTIKDFFVGNDVFPWSCNTSWWQLPEDVAASLFDLCKEIRERAVREWPEDFKKWIAPEPEEADEEDEDDSIGDDDESDE